MTKAAGYRGGAGAWIAIEGGKANHRVSRNHSYGVRCGTVAAGDVSRWLPENPVLSRCRACDAEKPGPTKADHRRQIATLESRLAAALAQNAALRGELQAASDRANRAERQALRLLGELVADV